MFRCEVRGFGLNNRFAIGDGVFLAKNLRALNAARFLVVINYRLGNIGVTDLVSSTSPSLKGLPVIIHAKQH